MSLKVLSISGRWELWRVGFIAAAVIAAAATALSLVSQQAMRRTERRPDRMASTDLTGARASHPDFVSSLPLYIERGDFAQQIGRAGMGSSVVVTDITEAAPTRFVGSDLEQTVVAVTLKGSYPDLKAVLAESLDRHHEAVVQHLSIGRIGNGGDTEAKVSLVLLARGSTR